MRTALRRRVLLWLRAGWRGTFTTFMTMRPGARGQTAALIAHIGWKKSFDYFQNSALDIFLREDENRFANIVGDCDCDCWRHFGYRRNRSHERDR